LELGGEIEDVQRGENGTYEDSLAIPYTNDIDRNQSKHTTKQYYREKEEKKK